MALFDPPSDGVKMIMKNAMRGFALLATSVALVGVPGLAQAQMQVSGEGRVGVTFPTGDLSSDGAEAGLGLGAELMFSFQRNLSAYVGLHRYGFACDSDCEVGRNPRSTGVGAGLKVILPSPPDALIWARGGIVANRLATDDGAGERNVGFELGTGVDMPVAPRLYLVPNLGFVSHDAGGGTTASFLTFGLGLHYHFN
jgi:hypothetical protein